MYVHISYLVQINNTCPRVIGLRRHINRRVKLKWQKIGKHRIFEPSKYITHSNYLSSLFKDITRFNLQNKKTDPTPAQLS